VGATKVYPGHKVTDPQPESAVLDPAYPPYSSGGGFSNIYPIPDYQTKAVANYFANYSPPYPYYSALSPDSSEVPNITAIVGNSNGIYNRIGRGIPDVSANGDNDAVSYFLYFFRMIVKYALIRMIGLGWRQRTVLWWYLRQHPDLLICHHET